jgi:hypothetical protein
MRTLASTIDPRLRSQLLEEVGFAEMVARLRSTARLLSVKTEKSDTHDGYSRAVLVLHCDPEAVSLLHSSRCGYRAQYYQGIAAGEHANAHAVGELRPSIAEVLRGRRLSREWLEASLYTPLAKVWVHQGLWFRYRRIADRVIRVRRWQLGLRSTCKKERQKALWGSLHPTSENRLELKGAFVDRNGEVLNHKPGRGREIRDLGYT